MKPRWRKEFRALLPGALGWWLMVALLVPLQVFHQAGTFEPAWWLAVSVLAAAVFGQEFSTHTLERLLSQPVSRRRLWYDKILPAAVMILVIPAAIILLMVLLDPSEILDQQFRMDFGLIAWRLFSVAVFAFGVVPWLTLRLRSLVAGAVFGIFLLNLLWISLTALVNWGFPEMGWFATVQQFEFSVRVAPALGLGALGYLLGCRQFLYFQVVDDGRNAGLLSGMAFDWRRARGHKPGHWGWLALVKKELRLHQVGALAAALFCLTCLATALSCKPAPAGDAWLMAAPLFLYWFILPVVIGAMVVAEERNSGLLECQLTLPPSRLKQWIIKALAANALLLILGVLLPTPWMVYLDSCFSRDSLQGFGWAAYWRTVPGLFWGAAVAMLASSLCRSSLNAILLAYGAAGVFLLGLMGLELLNATTGCFEKPDFAPGRLGWPADGGEIAGRLQTAGIFLLAILTILVMPYRNFRRNESGPRRALLQLAAAFAASLVFLLIYLVSC